MRTSSLVTESALSCWIEIVVLLYRNQMCKKGAHGSQVTKGVDCASYKFSQLQIYLFACSMKMDLGLLSILPLSTVTMLKLYQQRMLETNCRKKGSIAWFQNAHNELLQSTWLLQHPLPVPYKKEQHPVASAFSSIPTPLPQVVAK